MATKKLLTVDPERIERLLTALSFASVDMFDDPKAQVQIGAEDELGTLESTFAVFLSELAQAKSELHNALAETAASRDELRVLAEPGYWYSMHRKPSIAEVSDAKDRALVRFIMYGF